MQFTNNNILNFIIIEKKLNFVIFHQGNEIFFHPDDILGNNQIFHY